MAENNEHPAHGEPGHDCDEEFESAPAERVFFHLKLFLDIDNRPRGVALYRGDNLKALGVDKLCASECRAISEMVERHAQAAIHQVGAAVDMAQALKTLFGGGDDQSDDNEGSDSSAGESGEQQQSAAGVSGDS